MDVLIDCWNCDAALLDGQHIIDLLQLLQAQFGEQGFENGYVNDPDLALRSGFLPLSDGAINVTTLVHDGRAWVGVNSLSAMSPPALAAAVAETFHAADVEYGVIERGLAMRAPALRVHEAWGRENPEREAAPWWRTGWRPPETEPPA